MQTFEVAVSRTLKIQPMNPKTARLIGAQLAEARITSNAQMDCFTNDFFTVYSHEEMMEEVRKLPGYYSRNWHTNVQQEQDRYYSMTYEPYTSHHSSLYRLSGLSPDTWIVPSYPVIKFALLCNKKQSANSG